MNIEEYIVLHKSSAADLSTEVNSYLSKGFTIKGKLIYNCPHRSLSQYVQVMVKLKTTKFPPEPDQN